MIVGDYESSYTWGKFDMIDWVYLWNYGVEVWCNLEGRFVTIEADLSHLAGQSYE